MVEINEADDVLCVKSKINGETIETITGKQISQQAFIAFGRQGIYWAWCVHEYDAPIVDGTVTPTTCHVTTVNPEGFIFHDEIYKIKVAIT